MTLETNPNNTLLFNGQNGKHWRGFDDLEFLFGSNRLGVEHMNKCFGSTGPNMLTDACHTKNLELQFFLEFSRLGWSRNINEYTIYLSHTRERESERASERMYIHEYPKLVQFYHLMTSKPYHQIVPSSRFGLYVL
jgi:hypothetical protein